jgi:hypothetical protein
VLAAPPGLTWQLAQCSSSSTANGGYYGYHWPNGTHYTNITYPNGVQAYLCTYGPKVTTNTDLPMEEFYRQRNEEVFGAAAEAAEPPRKKQVQRWGPPL